MVDPNVAGRDRCWAKADAVKTVKMRTSNNYFLANSRANPGQA